MKYKYGSEIDICFRRLTSDDKDMVSEFECGNDTLSYFLHKQSFSSKRNVTYIFIDKLKNKIVCFCSICCNGILTLKSVSDVKEIKIIRENIPSIEIDYFAVDENYKNLVYDENSTRTETLSKGMFLYLIEYIKNIADEKIGAEKICLYSVPEAKTFYKRCGFEDFSSFMVEENKPYLNGCIPLYYNL